MMAAPPLPNPPGPLGLRQGRALIQTALILLAVNSLPVRAAAEGLSMTRPADCTPVITIQRRGCEVETQLRCGGDLQGNWRVESYIETGLETVELLTPEQSLIEQRAVNGEFVFMADLAKSWSTPIDQLKREGKGEGVQVGFIQVFGMQRPVTITASLKRTAPFTLPSGVVLDQFESVATMQMPPPMPPVPGTGFIYYHAPTGAFFEGDFNLALPGATPNVPPKDPAAIYLPGETGFDVNIPSFDCAINS